MDLLLYTCKLILGLIHKTDLKEVRCIMPKFNILAVSLFIVFCFFFFQLKPFCKTR